MKYLIAGSGETLRQISQILVDKYKVGELKTAVFWQLIQSNENGAGNNKTCAENGPPGEALPQKQCRQNKNERDAQTVHSHYPERRSPF